MAKTKRKTKAQELQEAVAEAVGAGRELHLESVDFSNPNRPKTCLEVDFPILPINHVAAIEGNAGKPIYQMSKWWARRRSSVFRAMLIAAATRAPDDPAEAAKTVWDAYYGNHQENEAFRNLKVADIFMGGGTTVVEGARLGMQMLGNDLNPVAWLVVKNELAEVDLGEVQKTLREIESEVKPHTLPFYACDCPRGHRGEWTHTPTGTVMTDDFDPLNLAPEERPDYEYEGPEIIYTFWAKHGPCQATECNHRTPIMTSPVIAVKTLTVKAWAAKKCTACGKSFDIDQKEARMAPGVPLIVADSEQPFSVMDSSGLYSCPHCGHECQDLKAALDGDSSSLGKAKNKRINLTLLIHPEWVKGSPGCDSVGTAFGGTVTDSAQATAAWNLERQRALSLIEHRGTLPESVTCPDSGLSFATGSEGGTVPRQAHFTCQQCGLDQKVMASVSKTGKHAPVSEYAIQGYCPTCDAAKEAYSGRFFAVPTGLSYVAAAAEWEKYRNTLFSDCWPTSEIPYGNRTHIKDPLHKHGYTHWWHLFNLRQLYVHSLILRTLRNKLHHASPSVLFLAGVFQQYLRNHNTFCIWNLKADKMEPFFSNNNFNPKNRFIENNVFAPLGRGNWRSCADSTSAVLAWKDDPWEVLPVSLLEAIAPSIASTISGKSIKVRTHDAVNGNCAITCSSSTDLEAIEDSSLDLVITDPPFGDLIQYSELADFFYVWLRLLIAENEVCQDVFSGEYSPKALEAVANETRHPNEADAFYKKVLTSCWTQCYRKLKESGVLAFTFHHSEDEPWLAVLESLFDAGFILEATFPIRSDETKGQGEFGSQKIEFDIIHVCRKRLDFPQPVSWARLRRQIMKDVRQLQEIIEQHQKEGIGEADLQVIRRGKALEYYSRHYGKVYIEKGREEEFTVKDALVGINQILDDESDTTSDAPPVLAEPYTRQFLRLFADKSKLERDQMQKYLRGTGVSPSEFLERGWCSEEKKIFTITPPLEWATQWKGKPRKGMSRDFDQSYFLVGACYDNSGIKVSDTLNSGNFAPHPAIGDLLEWFGKHGCDDDMKSAAGRAKQIYATWLAKHKPQSDAQKTLFDLNDEGLK